MKFLGVSELDEICLAKSLPHLTAKKKEFAPNRAHRFEFLQKG
jgi:hypothetical protein